MGEFAVLEPRQCLPIPDAMSFEEAAMLEPLQVSVHAANLMDVRPGETVAVVGAGSIGLGCMEMAKVAGAGQVLVTDRLDYRLELARKLGADAAIQVERDEPVAAAMDLTGGRGADVVFECTNRAAGTPQAYDLAAVGGRVALVGIPEEDTTTIDPHTTRRKELAVQFIRRSRHAARQAIGLVARGQLDVASWITHRFGLDDAPKAFELVESYADGILKAVVQP
jgi:L-iditol 2-dehydrogenase